MDRVYWLLGVRRHCGITVLREKAIDLSIFSHETDTGEPYVYEQSLFIQLAEHVISDFGKFGATSTQ